MEAIRSTSGGVLLELEVSASARETVIPSGYDVWRKRITVRVAAAPHGGKANAELIKGLSTVLKIPPSHLSLVSGHRSTKKTIKIEGIEPEYAYNALFDR
ncbi:MAG: DUF167 domain-containing protein [Methermicoccaceae archaeon]